MFRYRDRNDSGTTIFSDSFETETLADWTVTGSNGFSRVRTTALAYDGDRSLSVTQGSTKGPVTALSRTITGVEPNVRYLCHFVLRTPALYTATLYLREYNSSGTQTARTAIKTISTSINQWDSLLEYPYLRSDTASVRLEVVVTGVTANKVIYIDSAILRRDKGPNYEEQFPLGSWAPPSAGIRHPLSGVVRGTFADMGGVDRFVVGPVRGTTSKLIMPHRASGGVDSTDAYGWYASTSQVIRSLAWDGTRWSMCSDALEILYFTDVNWTSETSMWWAAYTWRDSNAGGAMHETALGKKQSFGMLKRHQINVTSGNLPDPSVPASVDDVNAIGIYLGRGTTEPDRTSMYYQGAAVPAGTGVKYARATLSAPTVTSGTTNSITGSTVGPDPTSTIYAFPNSGIPALVYSSKTRADGITKRFSVDGNGDGHFDGLIPPGVIMDWPGPIAPNGWMLLGTSIWLSQALYPDLFNNLGGQTSPWGVDNVNGTFKLPDSTDKFLLGGGTVGTSGGSFTATLAAANLPQHSHDMSHGHGSTAVDGSHDHGHMSAPNAGSLSGGMAAGAASPAWSEHTGGNGVTATGSSHSHIINPVTGGTGGGTGLTNTPFAVTNPYVRVNRIIKL